MSKHDKIESSQDQLVDEIQFISFKLGGKDFAINIDAIKEILKVSDITPIPRSPDFLLGLMNLRGNIVPVIDPKIRLKLLKGGQVSEISDRTRILVVIIDGIQSGILVDEVSEVKRIKTDLIEQPPQVVMGIDKFYLTGVVKLKEENRLILMLNLKELLNIEIEKIKKLQADKASFIDSDDKQKKQIDEQQVVTFVLGDEEFGIDITHIKEILRVDEITHMPNVPEYVKGIQNIRDMIIPVIDMRKIVQMESIEEMFKDMVHRFRKAHGDWVDSLRRTINEAVPFEKSLDPVHSELGRILASGSSHFYEVNELFKRIREPHEKLHQSAIEILSQLDAGNRDVARQLFEETALPYNQTILGYFDQLDEILEKKGIHEQRILIVDVNNIFIGFLVDRVFEVLRFPKEIVDTTPSIISTYGNEIKGVAKLESGSRLILIVDETQLISTEDVDAISKIHESGEELQTEKEDRMEKQYVVFTIHGEEYGIGIDKVQEIFKVEEITKVPRSPEFIKGITNLRGNIIPVIDIRKRFGIDDLMDEYLEAIANIKTLYRKDLQEIDRLIQDQKIQEIDFNIEETKIHRFLTSYKSYNEKLVSGLHSIKEKLEIIFNKIIETIALFKRDVDQGQAAYDRIKSDDIEKLERYLDDKISNREIDSSKNDKILVVILKDLIVGLLVDSVQEVLKIWDNLIVDAPSLVISNIDTAYLEGIAKLDNGNRIILILDINNLMSEQDFKRLKKMEESKTQSLSASSNSSLTPDGAILAEAESVKTKKTVKKEKKAPSGKSTAPKKKKKLKIDE